MKKAGVKMLRDKEQKEEDGIMLKEEKVYMPRDEVLRTEIIRLHHNISVEKHGGQWKTVELVTRNFWQPGVTRDVKRYVEGCDVMTWQNGVMPYKRLGKISDILHLNNENNQLER